jgi:hypothetical protein
MMSQLAAQHKRVHRVEGGNPCELTTYVGPGAI